MSKPSLSSVARTMASARWPQVQEQRKLAAGIYWFSSAGHGGAVALLDHADLPADAVEAARATGKVELVAIVDQGRATKRYTSERYTADSLRALAAQSPDRVKLFECWLGEEDCDWATLALVSPAMRAGMNGSICRGDVTEQDARECCERWNADYLARLN